MHAGRRPWLAALGTLTRDTTVYADGTTSENLGGLFYTLATAAHLFAGQARLQVLANVGADFHAAAVADCAALGVETGAIRRVPELHNHVYLTYRDAEKRDEVLQGGVPPVDAATLAAARGADHLIVNLTSGSDVELGTLQAFRRGFGGVVQLDVHSLTLGFTDERRRVLRVPEAWEAWLACADWVQMNEVEARLLGGGAPLAVFARRVLDLGPRGVVVTRAAHGCSAAWRAGGAVRSLDVPAPSRPEPAYPTGCGDVFGATFAYARLSGLEVGPALGLATGVASTKAAHEPHAALADIRRLAARHLEAAFATPA